MSSFVYNEIDIIYIYIIKSSAQEDNLLSIQSRNELRIPLLKSVCTTSTSLIINIFIVSLIEPAKRMYFLYFVFVDEDFLFLRAC